MHITWKDKILKELGNILKAHKMLKIPVLLMATLVSFIYAVCNAITGNTKRLTGMFAVFFVFVISTSFAFESYSENYSENYMELSEMQDVTFDSVNQNELTEDETIASEKVLDDEDVLMGYDNEELEDFDQPTDAEQFTLDDILKANQYARVSDNNQSAGTQNSLSADDWQLLLINKQHPVPEDYAFELGNVTGTMQCDVRIIEELLEMLKAAKEDGIELLICSPYRDYNRQTVLFNRKINSYMGKGYSYVEAYKMASQTVTVPGASEHQIGLALDIISSTYSQLNAGFGETEAGIWLKEHSKEYGFILRYPLGKEYITGIEYEPWHFRYVGKEAATIIMDREITLEELVEELERKV